LCSAGGWRGGDCSQAGLRRSAAPTTPRSLADALKLVCLWRGTCGRSIYRAKGPRACTPAEASRPFEIQGGRRILGHDRRGPSRPTTADFGLMSDSRHRLTWRARAEVMAVQRAGAGSPSPPGPCRVCCRTSPTCRAMGFFRRPKNIRKA